MEAELFLHRVTVGRPGLAARLCSVYGSAETVLAEFDPHLTPVPDSIQKRLHSPGQVRDGVARDLAWADQARHHLILASDPSYPSLLLNMPDPPYLLFAMGRIEALQQEQIAVVGSRRPTPEGLTIAAELAADLALSGFTITSGLASGIDAAAHRGALKASGTTIAVQGCGLDSIYPRRHEKLAMNMLERGALISEYPIGFGAHARHFPQRNRIVTGLSRGTLVVEATERSGSLISARLAMEQGREVFVVPGSIRSRQSEGCHQLIRQGATLVTSVLDIAEEFPDLIVKRTEPVSLSATEARLKRALSEGPRHADYLHETTEIPLDELVVLLVSLEVKGLIESGVDGYRWLKNH